MKWGLVPCVVVWLMGCGGSREATQPPVENEEPEVGSPAQGAFRATLASASAVPAGKRCPTGGAVTFDLPEVGATTPSEQLDADTYLHALIDGDGPAAVTCLVHAEGGSVTFSGSIAQGGTVFAVESGSLDDTSRGTARVRLANAKALSGSLGSPVASCDVDAVTGPSDTYEVGPGKIWARFSCASVEQQPTDYCKAEGYFVLENCEE